MKLMLLAATAITLLSSAGYAQTSTSGSNSQSTATNSSASQAASQANPHINVIGAATSNGNSSSVSGSRSTANTRSSSQSASVGNRSNIIVNTYAGIDGSASRNGDPSTASDPAGDPTINSNVHYSGGYSVHNVPEVVAPNIVGGNPCAIGASGGLAVSGFGITGGATWADKQCERRQQAALLYNIGKQKAAVELMCQDDNVRVALRVSGEPCTADQQVAQQPPTIAAVPAAPVIATAAAPVAASVAPVAPTHVETQASRPEWCYTASVAEMRRHAECDIRS